MGNHMRVKEEETDNQQLGFEHFIADVEDSNVEFKQSQKVRHYNNVRYRLIDRTEHARNLIRRECRMLNYWNCRNDFLRIQRIGSSRRSRPVGMSMAEYHGKTGHQAEVFHGKYWTQAGSVGRDLWIRRRRKAKRTAR